MSSCFKARYRCTWAASAAVLFLATTCLADVSLRVSANREDIYIGESFLLSVMVQGTDSTDEPDVSRLQSPARVRFLGSQNRSNYSVVLVNGKVTRSGFSGREFTYEVTPNAPGSLSAGPVTLRSGSRVLSADGPTVRVQGIGEQDSVFVRVTSTRDSVLVDEPFAVTVAIAIRRLPGHNAAFDPLDPQSPPNISIPFLSEQAGAGLSGPDIRQYLQERLARRPDRPAFSINDFTARTDPFAGMFGFGSISGTQQARFELTRRETRIKGHDYFEYYLAFEYTPKQETDCTFGPIVFKGSVITDVGAGGSAVQTRILAVGPACTVRVVPPPEADRPATYIGAIGSNMTVDASVDTQTCKVGDPLTLTLTVSGDINVRSPIPPVLSEQAGVTRSFRVYDDTVKTITDGRSKQFVYRLRPTQVGTLELPPLALSYYDVGLRRYQTTRTDPIPIRSNPVAEFSDTSLLGAGTNSVLLRMWQGDSGLPPAPIDVSPEGMQVRRMFDPGLHLPILGSGPLFAILALFVLAVRRSVPGMSAKARRLTGIREAMRFVTQSEALSGTDPAEAIRLEARAIRRCLETHAGAKARSWTAEETETNLKTAGVPSPLAADCAEVLRASEGASFAQGPHAFISPDRTARGRRLLLDLDTRLREAGKGNLR